MLGVTLSVLIDHAAFDLHMLLNVRLLDGNRLQRPRTRASPVMIDFKIKPAPGSAYRPKNVRVSGGGGMSAEKYYNIC